MCGGLAGTVGAAHGLVDEGLKQGEYDCLCFGEVGCGGAVGEVLLQAADHVVGVDVAAQRRSSTYLADDVVIEFLRNGTVPFLFALG